MKTTVRTLSVSVIAALALACGESGSAPAPDDLPLPTFQIDPTLVAAIESAPLAPRDDGQPRPLARVLTEDGIEAEMVANEIWVHVESSEDLSATLALFDASLVELLELGEGATQVLLRLPNSQPRAPEPADLRQLDAFADGVISVSSEQALTTLAVAAEAAAEGHMVGVNWVGRADGIVDRTVVEGPDGPGGYTPNPFAWPTHSLESPQATGVAEAWRALALAGRGDARTRVAALDKGFSPGEDITADADFISVVPGRRVGDAGSDWHGTLVTQTLAALPDNRLGTAGSGAHHVDPLMVWTSYDYFTTIVALTAARAAGARIATMSYGARIPKGLKWTAAPLQAATALHRRAGMLLFASAGNDGRDVDHQRCFFGACWERTLTVPCESRGVTCVGGLDWDSDRRASGSNYGLRGGVHIFGPYTTYGGQTPDTPRSGVGYISGTSFATPFVAGVAALVWSADPSLSASAVRDLLMTHAHEPGTPLVPLTVNALDPVLAALGDIPPVLEIVAPQEGASYVAGVSPISLIAAVEDFEDARPEIQWSSDREGIIGTTASFDRHFRLIGRHCVTAQVTDAAGQTVSDRVCFTVEAERPELTIVSPTVGTEHTQNEVLTLNGRSLLLGRPGQQLDDDEVQWSIDGMVVAQGHSATITTPLALGSHQIRFTGSNEGSEAFDELTIQVVAPTSSNAAPSAVITSPRDGASFFVDERDDTLGVYYTTVELCGHGVDPEDGVISGANARWTIRGPGETAFRSPMVNGSDGCAMMRMDLDEGISSTYRVRLEVTDSAGETRSQEIDVVILILI